MGGQGLAEYAVILALIAIFVLAGLLLLGAHFGSSVSLSSAAPSAASSAGSSGLPGPSFLAGSPLP